MKIAIVGAGLAGLSIAWHLSQSGHCTVTLFDAIGIGSGASGISAGLMHPYPSKQGRRSFLADEGIAATKKLLKAAQRHSRGPLAKESGILLYPHNEMQRALLLSYTKSFEDIAVYDERAFLAHVGMTIFCKPYLETLWLDAQSQGVKLVIKKIMGVEELVGYDRIVLAAGEGIFAFPQVSGLRLEPLKGQILRCAVPEGTHLPEQSMIGKGYIAHVGEERACFIGSTYERGEFSPLPDLPKAYEDLLPKVSAFYPQAARFIVTECRAAFRVMRIGHYFPMAGRLKENIWLCTALGSRGLLYHGLLGERMSQALLCDDPSLLPQEFSVYTKT